MGDGPLHQGHREKPGCPADFQSFLRQGEPHFRHLFSRPRRAGRLPHSVGNRQGAELPVVTDVHTAQEAEIAAEYVDLLQVPAFLCRQTDLLEACAKSGRPVNIKKGQFLAPWDTVNIGEKMRAFGCDEFMMCERGTTFGYNNLVVDMRSLYWMKQEGFPVVFDATHAVQKPGGLGGTTGGDSELAPVLASAAMATGSIDGVFMEVHKDPSKALSDGPNQIPLHLLEGVLKRLQSIHQAVQS